MKKCFILLVLFLLGNNSFALDIVYPKTHEVIINSPTTFFVGSSKMPVIINNRNIKLHPSGGFVHFVKLKNGENLFEIKSGNHNEIFKITKKINCTKKYPPLLHYDVLKYLMVSYDNTPLRNRPDDYGTRISHFQQGVLLTADAEQGDFYRIVLNDKYAWIAKDKVQPVAPFENANLYGIEEQEDEDFINIIFHLDKKTPFEITEDKNLYLKFYNLKNNSNYEFEYPIQGKLTGYNGGYSNQDFILKIRKPITINEKHPIKNITITIDAGHGGSEFGAISCFKDKEKDLVLKTSKYLQKELRRQGANVIMTREHDTNVDLYERVQIANKNNSLIFISIHNNALPDSLNPNEFSGTSVYYYYDEAKPLAEEILKSMTKNLGTNNDGIHKGSFAVIRNTQALSIIIEVGYLINPNDAIQLINKNFQKQAAKAIRKGIENYLLSD